MCARGRATKQKSVSAAQDAAVLVHGLTDHRDGFVLPQLAHALAGAGVCSLRLDMRGNGESKGEFEFANMRDEARPRGAALRSHAETL